MVSSGPVLNVALTTPWGCVWVGPHGVARPFDSILGDNDQQLGKRWMVPQRGRPRTHTGVAQQ